MRQGMGQRPRRAVNQPVCPDVSLPYNVVVANRDQQSGLNVLFYMNNLGGSKVFAHVNASNSQVVWSLLTKQLVNWDLQDLEL